MTAPPQPQEKPRTKGGFWKAFISVVDRPTVALRYAAAHTRSWWIPALLILVSLVVLTVISAPLTAQMTVEKMQDQLSRLNLPEAQMQEISGFMQEPDQTRIVLTGGGGGLVALGLGWVVWATILHFSALALGGESSFSSMFSVLVWSGLPSFLRNLIQAVYIGSTGQAIVNPGLSGLVATGDLLMDSTNVLWVLLSSLDLCLLWHLALVVVGFGIVSGFGRFKSAWTVMIWWVVGRGLGLVPVLLGRRLMTRFMGR